MEAHSGPFRITDRRPLGMSGRLVSRVCLGTAGTEATVCAAFDAGINFFFVTTDMHWPEYEATRRGLTALLQRRRSMRDDIVVAAVCYLTQPEFCWRPFAELVAAIPRLGRIDVSVAGGAYGREWRLRLAEYQEHRRTGFLGIGAIGASFHDRRAALRGINAGLIDLAFSRYNPLHVNARTELFERLRRRRAALLYNFNSTHGFVGRRAMAALGLGEQYWRPRVTDCYRFALARPEIDGLLVAMRSPAEVAALARALERGPLDDEEQQYMTDLAALNAARLEDPSITRATVHERAARRRASPGGRRPRASGRARRS
jgi:hypothetical protein